MKQFRPLGLVLLVVFAFGAVVAASASAARKATPEMLPIAGFTDKSGVSKLASPGLFGSTNTVACASSVSTGAFQTALLGTFAVRFEKCLLSTILGLFLCTGLGDTAGSSSISVLGTFHLRYRELTGTKTVVAFLIKVVHFACVRSTETRLILVRGCAAGEITPVNTKISLPTPFVMDMKKEAGNESHNEITSIASETGTTLETCKLESSEDPGTTWEQSAEETKDEIFGKATTGEIMA